MGGLNGVREVKEGIQGGTANTKVRSRMETSGNRSYLK